MYGLIEGSWWPDLRTGLLVANPVADDHVALLRADSLQQEGGIPPAEGPQAQALHNRDSCSECCPPGHSPLQESMCSPGVEGLAPMLQSSQLGRITQPHSCRWLWPSSSLQGIPPYLLPKPVSLSSLPIPSQKIPQGSPLVDILLTTLPHKTLLPWGHHLPQLAPGVVETSKS